MARKPHRYHCIYKTTCKMTGRYYIGMHSTSNLEDGYIGSGKRLWLSIRKYGRENHEREILEFLPDRDALKKREKELVNEDTLKDSICMNIQPGGGGGWKDKEHQLKCSLAASKAHRRIENSIKKLKELLSDKTYFDEWRTKISKGRKNRSGNIGMTGKKHSDETILKMQKYHSLNNSQAGTMWITNDKENKKIKKTDMIPIGWRKGRRIKLASIHPV